MIAAKTGRSLVAAAVVVLAGLQAAPRAAGQNDKSKGGQESFSALAVVQGGPGAAVPVNIVINQWSTAADENKLLEALSAGQSGKKLLDLLEDMPTLGSIAAPGSVGIQLRFARRSATGAGGEHITLLANRPLGFAEAAAQARSTDYPFTIIDLNVNGRGEGQGTVSLATKINMDRDTHTIVLENYDIQPIQLTSVKRDK
jgi:hypothetical protein